MRQIYSALTIYVLLHVSRCLVCKLNSLWHLLNEKMWENVIIYKYLMPMIADILIVGVTNNYTKFTKTLTDCQNSSMDSEVFQF